MPCARQSGCKLRGEFSLLICCRRSRTKSRCSIADCISGGRVCPGWLVSRGVDTWFRREVVEGFCYHEIKVVLPAEARAESSMRRPGAQTGGLSQLVRGCLSWRLPEPRF
jgi:hypothetical protein